MIKQYKILSAEKARGNADQYGNITFWLDIEGEGRALVVRKPDSPMLTGLNWGEIEEKVSKAGNPYKRFKVKQNPDMSGNGPAQRPVAAGTDDPRHHTMRAANLLLLCKNAAAAVLGDKCDPEDARSLFIYLSRAGYVSAMPDHPTHPALRETPDSTIVESEPPVEEHQEEF